MKQKLALRFCRSQNRDISILAGTHVNQDQLHQLRNNWLGPILCSTSDTFTKRMLVVLQLGFNDVTIVDIDPKGRFLSFSVAPSEDRVLCIYVPLGHNNRQQLARGHFLEGLQTFIESKSQGNEKKNC